MRLLVWLFRGAVFFTLFAFALNNLEPVTLNWFFDYKSQAPLVIVVLAAFAVGCAFGILAMVPAWWRHRRVARRREAAAPVDVPPASLEPLPLVHPPRDGL